MLTRKTLLVDQEILDRARETLGTRSDSETITEALDRIVFQDEVTRGIREIAGSKSMRDIFSEGA